MLPDPLWVRTYWDLWHETKLYIYACHISCSTYPRCSTPPTQCDHVCTYALNTHGVTYIPLSTGRLETHRRTATCRGCETATPQPLEHRTPETVPDQFLLHPQTQSRRRGDREKREGGREGGRKEGSERGKKGGKEETKEAQKEGGKERGGEEGGGEEGRREEGRRGGERSGEERTEEEKV